jgi:hypothetical protein
MMAEKSGVLCAGFVRCHSVIVNCFKNVVLCNCLIQVAAFNNTDLISFFVEMQFHGCCYLNTSRVTDQESSLPVSIIFFLDYILLIFVKENLSS